MTRVLIDDPDLARHLVAARTEVEVCDGSGLVLGRFVPQVIADQRPTGPPQRTGDAGDDEFWKSVGIQ